MYNQTVIFWQWLKGALFLLYELNDDSALSLISAFKSCFFWSVTRVVSSDFVCHDKEVQMKFIR